MAYITVDADLNDFDDDDIIEAAIDIAKGNKKVKYEIFNALSLSDIDATAVLNDNTIRDVQYLEVFEQLKSKFTVSQLEELLK